MPSAFVGRERERAAAGRLLDLARTGTPRSLLISGEPGTGKTSLLRELVAVASRRGFRAFEASADVTDAAVPYSALRLALEHALENETAPALAGLTTSLAEAFTSGAAANGDVAELLRRTMSGWAERQPLIVAVDDLHAADADSAASILYLMRHLRRDRVLVAATTRVDPPDLDAMRADAFERLRTAGAIEVITLGALDADELGLLVTASAGSPPDPSLLATLVERTGGNPFFAGELLRAVEESGALVLVDGLVGVAPGAEPTLPRRVTTAVLHRVFRLGADARAIASSASLFSSIPLRRLPLLATLSGLGPTRCATAFDRLVAARILVGESDLFQFSHAIVREALYEDLGPATRERLHGRVAMLLSDGEAGGPTDVIEIAGHVRCTQARPDPRAVAVLRSAGDAVAARAPQSAVGWYREALARLPEGDPAAAPILVSLAQALVRCGRHDDAARAATDAATVLLPGPERARAVLVGAQSLVAAGRTHDASAVLDDALNEPSLRSASLLVQRALVLVWQENLDEARRLLAEVGTGGADGEASMADVASMHLAVAAGRYREAMELADGLRRELDRGSPAAQSNIKMSLSMVAALDGDPREAVADAQRIEELRAGSPWSAGCAAWALFRLGRWDESVRHAESATDGLGASGDLRTTLALAALIAVHSERGDRAAAQRTLDLAGPASTGFGAYVDSATAVFHTTHGDHAAALSVLDAAAERESSRGRINCLAPILAQQAEVHWRAADRAAARRAGDRLRELPRDETGIAATMWPLLTEALVGGDPDAAEEARVIAVEHELAADAARALGLLGAMRDDAALLVQAYDELDRLGALHRQREISQHLRRLGRRAPRRRRPGDELTPTEAQIANLVAAGLTNRQIASEAILSPKTIEVYLSRIYTKTGCRSRVELAVAANSGNLRAST